MQQFEMKLIFLLSGRRPTAHRRSYVVLELVKFDLFLRPKTRKLMNKNQQNCLWSNNLCRVEMHGVWMAVAHFISIQRSIFFLFRPVTHKCLLTSAACVACVYWLCSLHGLNSWLSRLDALQNVRLFGRAWIVNCNTATSTRRQHWAHHHSFE